MWVTAIQIGSEGEFGLLYVEDSPMSTLCSRHVTADHFFGHADDECGRE